MRSFLLRFRSGPFWIGAWSTACGLFALLLIWIGGKVTGQKADLKANGVKIGAKQLGLTVLLALVVVAASYGLVFAADYFFKADFRFWVITLKAFTVDKLPIILMYLPLFTLYYIPNSISINSYNYFEMGGKQWVNTAVNALFNILASALMIVGMYGCFFISGYMPNELIWIRRQHHRYLAVPRCCDPGCGGSGIPQDLPRDPQPLSGRYYHGCARYHYELHQYPDFPVNEPFPASRDSPACRGPLDHNRLHKQTVKN